MPEVVVPADLLNRIPELEFQAAQLERQAEELTRKAHAFRQIIQGIFALNNGGRGVRKRRGPSGGGPRGRDAVLLVMHQRPDELWTTAEVKAKVRERGWPSSSKSIENSIHRLRDDGEVEFVQRGVYRLANGREED